jgi:DivIVA domain-containing protein
MPEERLLTISTSSHLAPDDVARHTFGSVRRGFDPDEVRTYLESLAAGLRGVADRERQLLDELADAEQRAANPVLDEHTLTTALGTETARVLHSAQEVAAEMVAKSEAEADRLLSEARQEIDQSRSETEASLAEQAEAGELAANELRDRTNQQVAEALESSRREAGDLLAQARDECREMVEEAQRLRARVLADLSKRRKVLHAQIEQLRAGRERLAEAVSDVRRSIDVIADDLFAAEDNARLAAEAAGREALARPDQGTPEELAAQLLAEEAKPAAEDTGPGIDFDLVEVASVEVVEVLVEEDIVEPRAEAESEGGAEVESIPEPGSGTDPPQDEVDSEPVVIDEVAGTADVLDGADEATGREDDDSPVEALFAKIRAARSGSEEAGEESPGPDSPSGVADTDVSTVDSDDEEEADDDGPPDDRSPFAVRRDGLTAPIVTSLARRLKRTLQDSQNELLDSLRSSGAKWSLDLLPSLTEHLDAYSTTALPALEKAAQSGASFLSTGSHIPAPNEAVLEIAHQLAESLVGPLRRRLADDGGLADADEAAMVEHVGSAFREWKGERIERLAGDHVIAAFSLGTIAAAQEDDSLPLEWVAVSDSGDSPCPDCEDNGLTGPQAPGEEFPTGHRYPPVHPGCRCLLAPSDT